MSAVVSAAWQPEGFADYRALYPRTPELPQVARDLTAAFASRWHRLGAMSGQERAAALAAHAVDTSVVFLRGYLAAWMPGNLVGPARALVKLGFDAHVVKNDTGGSLRTNLGRDRERLARRGLRRRVVFCGHSRGGHEARLLVASAPELAERCAGVILSQTPRGPSPVSESLLLKKHAGSLTRLSRRAAEALQRAGLHLVGARRGGLELTRPRIDELVAEVDALPAHFPVIQTASWSSRPTTWLDSFHQRLGEIAPGVAHDGQFFLHELVWPRLPNILLPHLDHAQPAMGGFGFDHARYWMAILWMLLDGDI